MIPQLNSEDVLDHAEYLRRYRAAPEGLTAERINGTVFLDDENDPQPDACLYRVDGSTSLCDGYLVGLTELIVEVAGSSASYDLGEKRKVYESAGVLEYLVFETAARGLEWWHLENGKYTDVLRCDGVFQSWHFPGLWLDLAALHAQDSRRLVETLRRGMAESHL